MTGAPTQVVNGASDQFLAGSGFPENQNGGVGCSDVFDLLQDSPQRLALADDLIEVELGSNLVFEVELFLGQLVLQFADLLKGQRIFYSNRDLNRNLDQEVQIGLGEGIDLSACESHCGNRSLVRDEGHGESGT